MTLLDIVDPIVSGFKQFESCRNSLQVFYQRNLPGWSTVCGTCYGRRFYAILNLIVAPYGDMHNFGSVIFVGVWYYMV